MKKSKKAKLIKVLVYFIYLFVLSELACRILFSVDPFYRRMRGNDPVTWRIDWIKRHKRQKRIHYKFDIYDPTKGWALKPNVKDMVVFDGKILNSNSKGLRGRTDYNYDKPANKIRILVLGDSYTFGEEVSDNETYCYYLQQMLPNTEVINFGIHGYGHDQMLIYLKEEGVKYRPNIVVLGFVYRDMYRNMLMFRDYAKPQFQLTADGLKLRNVPVPPPELILRREIYRLKLLDLFTMLYTRYMWKCGVNQKRMEELTAAILDEIIQTTISVRATPVFVYLPIGGEIESSDERLPGEEYLFTYCKKRGVRCMSLRPYFLSSIKDGVKLKTRGHWDSREHLIIAQGIKEYLLDGNMVNNGE